MPGFTPKQRNALARILGGEAVVAVAKSASVRPDTLVDWLRHLSKRQRTELTREHLLDSMVYLATAEARIRRRIDALGTRSAAGEWRNLSHALQILLDQQAAVQARLDKLDAELGEDRPVVVLKRHRPADGGG